MRTHAVGVHTFSGDIDLDGKFDSPSKTEELTHADKAIGAARTRGLAALVNGIIGCAWNPTYRFGTGHFDSHYTRSDEVGWVYDKDRAAQCGIGSLTSSVGWGPPPNGQMDGNGLNAECSVPTLLGTAFERQVLFDDSPMLASRTEA